MRTLNPTGDTFGPGKVTIDRIPGLMTEFRRILAPVAEYLRDKAYWTDLTPNETEYRSRDGFIPYSHNCGGLELNLVIPKCEEYAWPFLEFGECEECGKIELGLDRYGNPKQCGYNGDECAVESDGHLDARLRVWLKFEGLDETGAMQFYLVASGGNGDAPYFREKYQTTLFEASFSARTLAGLIVRGNAAVKRLLKAMGVKP